ncbi:hypothetical protein CaCOL14_011139 [Colletotrichum acutatum]
MMSTGCDATPTPSGSRCEVLRQVERLGGAQTMIDRDDLATGTTTPLYVLHSNKENKTVTVLHTDPRAQVSGQALSTAKYHSLSSKMDVILRGVPIKMKTNTMGNSHSMSMNAMYLKDAGGNLLATWKRYPEGRSSGIIGQSAPTFEIYVPP